MEQTKQIAGLELTFLPPGDREQIEIECILISLLAPGAAAGVGELARALAAEIVKLARSVCLDPGISADGDAPEVPPRWDLARLLHLRDHLDSTDPALEQAWDAFTAGLPVLAGELIGTVTPEVTDRLDHGSVIRLFELAVIGRTVVELDGKPTRIATWPLFRRLSRGRPSFKWSALAGALVALYLSPDPEPDPEPNEGA